MARDNLENEASEALPPAPPSLKSNLVQTLDNLRTWTECLALFTEVYFQTAGEYGRSFSPEETKSHDKQSFK